MKRSIQLLGGAAGVILAATGVAWAQQLTVDINKVSESGVGEKIGTVTIGEGNKGTNFKVAVSGVGIGKHGFHVHEKGDCAAAMKDGKMEAGVAAGPHYDPDGKKSHKGPQGTGHKGDLPLLTSNAKGIFKPLRRRSSSSPMFEAVRWSSTKAATTTPIPLRTAAARAALRAA